MEHPNPTINAELPLADIATAIALKFAHTGKPSLCVIVHSSESDPSGMKQIGIGTISMNGSTDPAHFIPAIAQVFATIHKQIDGIYANAPENVRKCAASFLIEMGYTMYCEHQRRSSDGGLSYCVVSDTPPKKPE